MRSILAAGLLFTTTICLGQSRDGLLTSPSPSIDRDETSFFSIGTLIGLGMAFEATNTYKVRNGVVVLNDEESRFIYGSYVLASFNLAQIGSDDKPLAFIFPAGLAKASTGDAILSGGFGLSLGINVSDGADVGVALALVMNPTQDLNFAQEQSLQNQTPLPLGESDEIDDKAKLGLMIGIYACPHL